MATVVTLNGKTATDARVSIPAWGMSYHDVTLDGEISFTGAATLVAADLTIQGTILNGGPGAGRSFFRIVAGAGGWGKTLKKKSYANDFGVKLITVLQDAANEVGETLDTTTIDSGAQLGPFFTRPAIPACRLLEQLSPQAWYVGEDGKTRLGQRAASTLPAKITQTTQFDMARGIVELASESIAGILPGVSVPPLSAGAGATPITAVDVEHEVSAKGGLRTTIWGQQGGGSSRRLSAFRKLFDQLDPNRLFRGIYEYRIVVQVGNRLMLQPVRVSTGMPDLQRVFVRPGVPGTEATHHLGARVLVCFIDGNPYNPAVIAFEDADGPGFLPTTLNLMGGGPAIGRVGDSVAVTFSAAEIATMSVTTTALNSPMPVAGGPITINGTITSGSSRANCG